MSPNAFANFRVWDDWAHRRSLCCGKISCLPDKMRQNRTLPGTWTGPRAIQAAEDYDPLAERQIQAKGNSLVGRRDQLSKMSLGFHRVHFFSAPMSAFCSLNLISNVFGLWPSRPRQIPSFLPSNL